MKALILNSSMTSLGGVFYPTGHVFALLPDEDCVRQAVAALEAAGFKGDIAYATAEAVLQDIVRTLGNADYPLPSVGAEGDIVRRIAALATRGYSGLLVQVHDHNAIETLAKVMREHQAAAAFHYRTFVIEELIDPPEVDAGSPQ